MNARELRIGNLLKPISSIEYPGLSPIMSEFVEVEGINYRSSVEIMFQVDIEWLHTTVWESSLEPIPLTEEWLIKTGLERREKSYYKYPVYISIKPCLGEHYFAFEFGDSTDEIEIKYVHQLQNLFFALTGEELVIRQENG